MIVFHGTWNKMASEENKSPWLPTLLVLTMIQASAFVTVTVSQFRALDDIDDIDVNLEHRLPAILSTPQVNLFDKMVYSMIIFRKTVHMERKDCPVLILRHAYYLYNSQILHMYKSL